MRCGLRSKLDIRLPSLLWPLIPLLNYRTVSSRILDTTFQNLNGILNKRWRIPKGQSTMINPEKLAIQGIQDKDKQNRHTTQYMHSSIYFEILTSSLFFFYQIKI